MTEQVAKQVALGDSSNANPVAYPYIETETETDAEPDSEVGLSCGGTTVTTTGIPLEVAPPPFLTKDEQEANLRYVQSAWPGAAPMTATMREAWYDVLCQLRVGELKPALNRRTDDKGHRPDPYRILELVLQRRQEERNARLRTKSSETLESIRAINAEPRTTSAASAMDACLELCAGIGIGKRARKREEANV